MQGQPHWLKSNLGSHLDFPWNWEIFYTHFSVCNVSIVRYKVTEMQLCTALGYLCINHENIGICLVLCPFVMKFSKFTIYAGDCRAPNDVVQFHLKHMLYPYGKDVCLLWAFFLNFECLSCILLHEIPRLYVWPGYSVGAFFTV